MIRDEDVIKNNNGKYMKPHEKVLYWLAIVFGVALAIAGIVMLAIGLSNSNPMLWGWGIGLIVAGIIEVIGVGLLLWTEGVKKNKGGN
ncbi:MAG: DUF4282 domain-containing protein [Firmicutes bacterium]|nr:DUF4282 domain-containing protein [Bacillota bacterium]